MASIEVGISRSPYAYGDMGQADFDDEMPTEVIVTARVENAGNATGRAVLRVWNLAYAGPEGGGSAWRNDPASGYKDIGAMSGDIGTPTPANFTVRFNLTSDDLVGFYAEVIDDSGNLLASRSFSVNPYRLPQAPELSAGAINVRVI